jgi:hypothetical protein
MRGWIASPPLRWLVFLLTTWCLNSDAVEAVFARGSATAASVAVVASAPNSTTTIRAFHLPGSHEARIRERCACHRGTVLPTGLAAEPLKQLPSFAAPVADLDCLLSVTAPPDLPPPRL